VNEGSSGSPTVIINWENAGEFITWACHIYPVYFLWSPW